MDYAWTGNFQELQVPWERKGDRWISNIRRLAGELGGGFSLRRDQTTGPFIEFSMNRDGVECAILLLVAALENGNLAYGYASRTSDVDESAILDWQQLVDGAAAAIRLQSPMQKWTAIIGQTPGEVTAVPLRLESPGRISHMRLRSSNEAMREFSASQSPSLFQRRISATFPILVRGSSAGYDWDDAQGQAARDLSRLCGLLSIAWGTLIAVREQAAPLEWGETLPPRVHPWIKKDHIPDTVEVSNSTMVEIGDWLNPGYARLAKNKKISDATSVFVEGLSIKSNHPSLALVSFISSIETIAGTLFRADKKCPKCESKHRDVAAKFREALKLVTSGERLKLLSGAYATRSLTVHSGRLHGSELTPGISQLKLFAPQPDRDFQWRIVYAMQEAARDLLLAAVRNELPGRLVLPER